MPENDQDNPPADGALDLTALQAALPGWRVVYFPQTTSTNDDARRLAAEGAPDWTAVLTDQQTAGRGRRGARWVSPPGRNGILSVLRRPGPDLPPERWARLTLAAALAGCDALDAVPGLRPSAQVKWPNDLYLSGRKVAGILVESAWSAAGGFLVIGTGFNLNAEAADFPDELRDTATSVRMEGSGRPVDRTAFLIRYLNALGVRSREALTDFAVLKAAAWRRSWLAGRRVSLICAGQPVEGIAEDLGPEGELQLRLDDGSVRLIASADLVRPLPDSLA